MPRGDESTRARRDLCVVFEIEPASESCCPLGGLDGQISEIRHQVAGTECHTDTTVQLEECACSPEEECTEVLYSSTEVEESCPCTVFGKFDCVPNLVDVVDGRLLVETRLSDRERLSALVESLKEITDGLRLRQLRRLDGVGSDGSGTTVTLDLHQITEKQRRAVATAVAEGYYSRPRETSIDELADEFGISTSALSQRLNAVESKLATAAFTRASAD